MAQPLSPSEVFLALVNGVAEGRWEELPSLYAELTHVVHPFDPLRPAALPPVTSFVNTSRQPAQAPRCIAGRPISPFTRRPDPEVIVAEFSASSMLGQKIRF